MFKGYKKRVIVVKDTGSRLFDSAYFIVNENVSGENVLDMVKEASRIIEEKGLKSSRSFSVSSLFAFSLGASLCSLCLAALALFTS